MKNIVFHLLFIIISMYGLAQKQTIEPCDSVSQLVKKYFNERNSEGLYSLGGEVFHSQISEATFRQICEANLFPFGFLQQLELETTRESIYHYKAVFAYGTLGFLMSLDKTNKIETFLFKDYINEKSGNEAAATAVHYRQK
jgi:hypothetical protein